jgi:hypothetical protein
MPPNAGKAFCKVRILPAKQMGLQQPQEELPITAARHWTAAPSSRRRGRPPGLKPQFRSHEQPDTSSSKSQPFVRFRCLGAAVRCLLSSRQTGPWHGIAEAQLGHWPTDQFRLGA